MTSPSEQPDTLTLAPEPRSARAARQHLASKLVAAGLEDLVDRATLLVSELVSNAVFHAATTIEVECRVSGGTVVVEVRDESPLVPSRRHFDDGAMTGRGVGIVEALADEWGVTAGESGKTVWFRLGDGTAAGRPELPDRAPAPSFEVRLLRLPIRLVMATVQYGETVLRELALVSLAGSAPGLPEGWQAPQIELGPLLTLLNEADQAGTENLDVTISFPEGSGAAAMERLALIDKVDRMAHEGVLLTSPVVPEIAVCRRWLLTQIADQGEGRAAQAWSLPEALEAAVEAVRLPPALIERVDALTDAAMIADDSNRIVHVNPRAGALLGWDPAELAGRRLTTIVPPALREAHLAGFTRFLLTSEPRIIGRPVDLPALRADGEQVPVRVTIDVVELEGGRRAFTAVILPRTD